MSNNQTVKHTPGPWQTGNFDGRSIYDCAPDGPVMVAKVSTLGLPAAETKANASLITSAPDLLAALEELLAHCAGTNEAFYVTNKASALRDAFKGQKELMQSARAALAKAKGE